jgi:hypothetical protein
MRVADQPAGERMLNGYEAFAVGGAFLVAAIFVWKKLRFIQRRLGELRNEINELRTVESRLFMMALNAKSKADPHSERPEGEASEKPSQ